MGEGNDDLTNENAAWTMGEAPRDMTADERLQKLEDEAEQNTLMRVEHDKKIRDRLKWEREHPDSREKYNQKSTEAARRIIRGQETKPQKVYVDPSRRIFGKDGRTDAFKSVTNRRLFEKFLQNEFRSSVSTDNRRKIVNYLEYFKDPNTKILDIKAVREAQRLIRTGQAGTSQKTLQAIKTMKEKGLIKDVRDLTKYVPRSAFNKINDVLLKQNGQSSALNGSRGGGSSSPNKDLPTYKTPY